MQKNEFTNRVTIKSNAASGPLLERLAVEILKAKKLLADPGITVYQLADRTILEIHKDVTFHPQDIFINGNTVLSFPVHNIDESVDQMLTAGARTIDGIVRLSATFAYCHLVLGKDQVVGIHQSC